MVCEIDQELIESYPLDELPWKPNPHGVCGMIRNPPRIEEFFELVKGHFDCSSIGLNMVSKVVPKQVIPIHTDRHDNGCRVRIHVPLKTNPDAWFYTRKEFHHMKLGTAYMVDPSWEHGVVNLGRGDRIHLVFNLV